jgi:hypothetical protein
MFDFEELTCQPASDPVEFDDITNSWGFWDETWTVFTGGYDTYEAASHGCAEYAQTL